METLLGAGLVNRFARGAKAAIMTISSKLLRAAELVGAKAVRP